MELEPIGSTIFFLEPLLAICQTSCLAAAAFWGIWAIEKGNVLVTYVLEPIDCLASLLLYFPLTYQCTLLASSKSPMAILWTGASPQRS